MVGMGGARGLSNAAYRLPVLQAIQQFMDFIFSCALGSGNKQPASQFALGIFVLIALFGEKCSAEFGVRSSSCALTDWHTRPNSVGICVSSQSLLMVMAFVYLFGHMSGNRIQLQQLYLCKAESTHVPCVQFSPNRVLHYQLI